MKLAGIEGVVIHSKKHLGEQLERAVSDPEIGIILITERFGREFPELIDDVKLNRRLPLTIIWGI